MDLEFSRYSAQKESELNNLFFDSVFRFREEYEYIKQHKWIDRYRPFSKSIQIIAENRSGVVGSIGILPVKYRLKGKNFLGGCFVDNCVGTKYEGQRQDITYELFSKLESEMVKKNYDFIIGWDYSKNKKHYSELLKETYVLKEKVNWISGGFEYKNDSPKKWKAGKLLFAEFLLMKLYNKLKLSMIKTDKTARVRFVKKTDLPKISDLSTSCYESDLAPDYNPKQLFELWETYQMKGLVVEKGNKIVAAALFQIGSWSGWMYGNPALTKDWEKFNTILPETFVVDQKFIDSAIPSQLAGALVTETQKTNKTSVANGFVTDVFDTSIDWRKKSYLNAGYLEPSIDYGMYVAKSFNSKLELETGVVWHVPPRNIISPLLK